MRKIAATTPCQSGERLTPELRSVFDQYRSSLHLTSELQAAFYKFLGNESPIKKDVQRRVFAEFPGQDGRKLRCLFRRYLALQCGLTLLGDILTDEQLGEQPSATTINSQEVVSS